METGIDAMEEEVEPRNKRRREQGPLGEGWERITPEKPQQSIKTLKGPETGNHQRFLDIWSKEKKITDFMVALKEAERSAEKEKTKSKRQQAL